MQMGVRFSIRYKLIFLRVATKDERVVIASADKLSAVQEIWNAVRPMSSCK